MTAGLLRMLSRREVRGVIAHEIAHIRNRDVTIATVAAGLAAVISGIANALQFAALFGGSSDDDEGGGSIFGALALRAGGAACGAALVQMAISRSREYRRGRHGGPADRAIRRRWRARWSGCPVAAARIPGQVAAGDGQPLHRQPARRRPGRAVLDAPADGGADRAAARAASAAAGRREPMDLLFPFAEFWWVYAAFTAGVLVVLAVDLGVFHRQAHAVTFRESLAWSVVWVALALARQLRLLPLRAGPVSAPTSRRGSASSS